MGLPKIGNIMQALRLNQVLMRVVAWHNRHPLARRINAAQVHSIGEVLLPFASARALPLAPEPPASPAMQDLLDPPATPPGHLQPHSDSDSVDGARPADEAAPTALATPADAPRETGFEPATETVAQADPPGATDVAPAEPAPVLSMEDEADDLFSNDPPPADEPAAPDDGPEMLVELSSDPDDPALAAAADSRSAPADEPAPGFTTADADSAELAAAFAAAADEGPAPQADPEPAAAPGKDPPADPPPADPPVDPAPEPSAGPPTDPAARPAVAGSSAERPAGAHPPATPRPDADAANTPPAGILARLWAQLKGWPQGSAAGLPRLQATFSRDFIWPLRPGQVARWARRHGSRAPLAPADWPQRLIDTDGSLLTQARRRGLPHDLALHVLTAAIGVGDRRIRVLIDAQGHILGPRAYSPPKLAALASLTALGLVGAGWGWLPQGDSLSAKQASAAVAAAMSAAAQAASAADTATAAAAAAERVWRAQQVASMLAGTTPIDAPPVETSHPAAPDTAHPAAEPAKPAPHGGQAVAPAHDAASAPNPRSAPEATAAPAPRQAVVALGTILPVLSAADKLAARQQGEATRSSQAAVIAAQPPEQAAPVFAIVTQPTREKESAARSLALIRASGQRLSSELPENAELMLKQGEWRAAWWPFETQADAERARVMLAARGLKVEVVAF